VVISSIIMTVFSTALFLGFNLINVNVFKNKILEGKKNKKLLQSV
jgi:hypothetical protein